MTFNVNFRPWEIILRWADGSTSAAIEAINQKLDQLIRMSEELSEDQIKLNALVAELTAKIDAEHDEVLAALADFKSKPLDLSGVEALRAKIEGIYNPAPPAAGKHNVSLGFRSSGDEIVTATLTDKNCDEPQAARLRMMYDEARAAGLAQAPGGAAFESTLFFEDNGAKDSITFTNEHQKAAADKSFGESIVAAATAQLP